MTNSVGFIGLGVMGLPMAERLLAQGLPLVVWNRTAAKAGALSARGASRAASPREVAATAVVVLTMLSDDAAVEAVALGGDGIAAGIGSGKVHCDMSTIGTETSRRLGAHYARQGAHFVHAPVLGNWRAAAAGSLLIFAGGAETAIERCRPVFAALGKKVWRWDRPEQATAVKLACNLLLGGMVELLAESLLLASRAGVTGETMLEIIGASALGAPMYRAKGETILQRGFVPPSFYLRHMRKDLELALVAGQHCGATLPATRAIRDVFAAAAAGPRADVDYSAVYEYLEELSAGRAQPA